MAKQLNIQLQVNANTQAAKKNLENLFESLDKISNLQPAFGMKMSTDLQKASKSAQDLENHLSKAMDAKTGNINLDKLELSLSKSKQSLSSLMSDLAKAGPTGQASFVQIARAISSAGTKLTKTQSLLSNFLTTLKNTARWQISSTMLHGVMGALQGSVGYAESLNKSLNNIRIVTGQNVDQMAKFAEEANKSAKALSSTTTAYTDAALIYYQQGLGEKEVKERTDTTIKLANITRQSAEEVSSQMTAIWNNFDDGSHKLEYYADVITKLGATTASSSDEIAEGLSKFASVADTVGLSYEKASSALATVVAETRQSADIVGTAFKTIFARIQGLNLGETLDDGVTLNKYSAALKAVGVNILDSNNHLKEADNILDELGKKWNNIGDAQKVALSETVAGTRQYSQFMALMNNYDKIQENQKVAENSEGTIEEQAKIYAESWEGAQKRVKASLESLYNELIPSDFLIKMTNGLSDVINMINSLVKAFGGLPGLLLLASTIITTKFKPEITQSLDLGIQKIQLFGTKVKETASNLKENPKDFFTGGERKKAQNFANLGNKIIDSKNEDQYGIFKENFEKKSSSIERETAKSIEAQQKLNGQQNVEISNLGKINNLSSLISQNRKLMTVEQANLLAKETDHLQVLSEEQNKQEQILETLRKKALFISSDETEEIFEEGRVETEKTKNGGVGVNITTDTTVSEKDRKDMRDDIESLLDKDTYGPIEKDKHIPIEFNDKQTRIIQEGNQEEQAFNAFVEAQQKSLEIYEQIYAVREKIKVIQADENTSEEEKAAKIKEILNTELQLDTAVTEQSQEFYDQNALLQKIASEIKGGVKDWSSSKKVIEQINGALSQGVRHAHKVASAVGNTSRGFSKVRASVQAVVAQENEAEQAAKKFQTGLESIKQKINDISNSKFNITASLTQAIQGISSLAMGLNSIKSTWETLNNEDASFFDKFTAGATGLSMAMMTVSGVTNTVSGAYNALKGVIALTKSELVAETIAQKLNTAEDKKAEAQKIASTLAKKLNTNADTENTIAEELNTLASREGVNVTKEEIAETLSNIGVKKADATVTGESTVVKEGETVARTANVAIINLEKVALWGLIGIAALAVAGIVALVIAFSQVKEQSPEEKLKTVTKSAEELGTAANEAKSKVESLRSAFDQYKTVLETLKACKEGTEEWKNALSQVQDNVRSLIAEYPELLGKLETLEDGTLGFSEETMKEVQKTYEKRQGVQDNTSIMSRAFTSEASLDVKKNEIAHSQGSLNASEQRLKQTILDDATSLMTEFSSNSKYEQTADGFLDFLKNKYGEDNTFLSATLNNQKVLNNFYESIQNLAKEIDSTSKQVNNATTLIAESATKQKYSDKSQSEQKIITEVGEAAYSKEYKRSYEELKDKEDKSDKNTLYSDQDSVWNKYLEATGVAGQGYTIQEVSGENGNSIIKYLDSSGESHELSYDAMAQTVAGYNANDQMEKAQEKASNLDDKTKKFLSNINYDSEKQKFDTSQMFQGYTSSDIGVIDAGINQIIKKFYENPDESLSLKDIIDSDKTGTIQNMLDSLNLTKEEFLSSYEELGITIADFDKGLEQATLTSEDEDFIDKLVKDSSSMTVKEKKSLIDSNKDIKSNMSSISGLKDSTDIIDKIATENKDLDPKKIISFQEGLSKVDLQSEKAAAQVSDLAKKYGIQGNAVVNFQDKLKNLDHTFNVSASDAATTSKKISELVNSNTKLGDTFTKENLEEFKKYGINTEAFFTKMKDGTYKLSNDANEFKKIVNDISTDKLKEAFKNIGKNKEEQASQHNVNTSIFSNTEQKANGATTTKDIVTTTEGQKNAKARLDFASSFDENTRKEMFTKIEGALDLIKAFQKNPAMQISEEQAKIIDKMIDATDKYNNNLQEQVFNTATSISELQSLASQFEDTNGSYNYSAYSSALISLASSYDNTTQEIKEYQEALKSGDTDTVKAAEDALTAATLIGEAAAKYGINANDTETQANLIAVAYKNANDGAELSATSAARLAIANQRLNNGVKTLKENWETWSKTLKTSNHTTKDYAETLNDANEALANLVGAVDGASIPVTFLDNSTAEGAQHLEWMTDAAKGNTTAINKLGIAVAQAQVKEMKFSETIKAAQKEARKSSKDDLDVIESSLKGQAELTEDTFNSAKTIFNSFIDGLANAVASGASTAQSYINSCGTDWINALNEMAKATGMSVEEMNAMLNELGVDVNVTSTPIKQKTKVPEYTTIEEAIPPDEIPNQTEGNTLTGKKSYTYVSGYKDVVETIEVAQINTENNAGKAPTVTYTGTSGSSSSYGGVSSSSTKSSNKTSAASQSNTVHRYSQESAAVNDLTKEYSRLNKAKDSAFGASKIQAMEQELAKLKQLKQASQNYLDSVVGSGNGKNIATAVYNGQSLGKMIRNGQVGGYTGADYNSLYGGINASGTNMTYVTTDSDGNSYNTSGNFSLSALNARFGTNLQYQFDSNGNIANKDSLLNALQALKNSEENRYSSISDPTGEQKTYHSQSLAYLSEMESRLNQYTSTLSTLQEQVDSYLDNIANMQAKNAEIISTKLSNGINLSSNTISKLNRAVIVLGDKIYKNAEDMKKFFSSGEQSLNEYEVQGKVNEQALNEAIEKYNLYVNGKNGKLNENAITPAEAAAIAKEIADNYDTLISDTKAKITELQEQYSNTLDYWTNKMNDVNSSVEKTISSLTHLQNVLNLIGQSTSYEKIDKVLRGKLTATTDDYKSKKRQSDEAEKAYNKAAKDYKDILAKPENKNMSDEAKDALYNSIVKKAKDDYQTKLAETEKALEDMSEISNSIFENSLNAAYAKYENAITGKYGSFNELENSMKRQSSIAEQYLTKTNQLYETNTMLRKLSQDIDKTDSQIAKQKLKAFSDEIQSMQTQEKLSKTDLDIAKARYEVLKAQIALEEAQNAKSTVRLRRDSEGNYGYVYTADQDKISDAEQNLADKENALYNLALSNAQNYTEKMIQLEKEYVEAEKQLYKDRADGLITNDGELKRLLGELQKQYQELGLAYSESYIASNTVLNEVGAQGETEAWTNAYNDILDNLSLFNNNSEDASQEHNSKILKMTNDLDNSLKDAWAELEESRRYYQAEAEAGNAQLEETVKSLTDSVKDQTNEVTKKGGLADSYKKATSESGKYMNKLAELYNKQENLIESFKNAADRANNFYNKVSTLKEETNNLAAAQERYNTALSQTSYYTGGNSGSGSGGSGSSGNGGSGSGKAIGPNKRWHIVTKNSDGTATLDSIDGYTIRVKSNNLHLYGLQNYKTGGYTGTWPASGKTGLYTGSWNGPDIEENGKLAFLHQKELVLNAQDTENMLNAVKLIRQISQTIDLQAMSQSSDVLMRSTPFAGERQTLQQDVVIHAEFPNATNHSEIEEAFENLVNRASQYANRSF